MQNQQLFMSAIRDYGASLQKIAAVFEVDDDLRQELYDKIVLAISQALVQFNSNSDLCIFVFQVAYNQVLEHVAKRQFEIDLVELDMEDELNVLRSLAPVQRQIACLSLDDFSVEDISEITGLSESDINRELVKANQDLNRMVRENQTSVIIVGAENE